MIPIKPFYMIRHGETEANANKVMAGIVDTPLTQRGIKQAQRARDIVAKLREKPTKIYHSQLSRTRDTAAIINEVLNVPMIENPDWGEMNMGEWAGQPHSVARRLFRDWNTPPGGETPQEFWDRIKHAHIKTLTEMQGATPLISCHGGVMRAIGKIHGIDFRGSFKNAHLYEFRPSQNKSKPFPWDVWDYDLSEDGTKLIKNISPIFE